MLLAKLVWSVDLEHEGWAPLKCKEQFVWAQRTAASTIDDLNQCPNYTADFQIQAILI